MKMYLNELELGGEKFNLVAINYVNEEKKEETKVMDSIHHIHILDRSYSMSGDINRLIDNVIETFEHIGEKDLISVIWFASAGECKTLFKGASIHQKDMIVKKLDSIRSCVGCTCFSEPLQEAEEIIKDLEDLCPNFNITLFTDGCTVTPWSSKEEENKIMTILKRINEEHGLLAMNTIGYGNWYDEDLLLSMPEHSAFGRFNHSKNITDYSTIFTHEYNIIRDNVCERVEVCSGRNTDTILYVTPKSAKSTNNGYFKNNFLNKTKNQFFILTKEDSFSINGITYCIDDITTKIRKPTLLNFLYAFAKELYYNKEQHKAIDVLALTGDKHLIDKATSAFTRDERAEVVKLLDNAFLFNKTRMLEGQVDASYVPKADAYNVIDFLSELVSVPSTYIPVENYNRIGKKVVDEFNLFRKNPDIEVSSHMEELVFNEKKLNVSIRYLIHGFVDLNPRQASKVGLENSYPTRMYRMQTIIKDGVLNIPKINIRISDHDKNFLSEEAKDIFKNSLYNQDRNYYIVDLTKLPVTNRMYSEMTALDVLRDTQALLLWKTRNKVIKTLVEKKTDEIKMIGENREVIEFTPEQVEVLKEHGLNNKLEYVGVANKIIPNEDGDFYETRSIEFGIKGCSSIPSVNASLKKFEDGKKLNILDQSIVSCIQNFKDEPQHVIINELALCKEAINKLSSRLFASKVSKVLTGGWWNELVETPKHEEYTNEDGVTLIVKTKREKVYL